MTKLIGNAVILIAGSILLLAAAIAVSIIFLYAAGVVLVRRLTRSPRPALTAGA
jgi:hypothetical protein